MATVNWPWAIILCKFNDVALEPQPVQYYKDFYTQSGTGGVCDYWREVAFDGLDLTTSRVFGWFTMSHSSSEVSGLHFPGDRGQLVQWGIDAAYANGVNLSPFRSILVVQNYGVDHGFAGNGVVIVHQNPALCEFGFICHEMGHGFGLPHSWSANPDTEYGDGWDIMSWNTATSVTSDFQITFESTSGTAGPGLNTRNVEALGTVPLQRIWTAPGPDFSDSVTLGALNQELVGSGYLIAEIPPNATNPARPSGSKFTIEFHRKAGWDQAIPVDTALIHEVRTNGLSYLQPTFGSQFLVGQQFVSPDPPIFVQVMSIDVVPATATIRLWDLPDGCLRKEDSDPKIYLVVGGAKCWIPSPQELTDLGFTFSQVKSVPDRGILSVGTVPRDGTLMRELYQTAVYVMFGNCKWHIPSPQVFEAMGYHWSDVKEVPTGCLSGIPDCPDNSAACNRLQSNLQNLNAQQQNLLQQIQFVGTILAQWLGLITDLQNLLQQIQNVETAGKNLNCIGF